jgi:acyl-CoA thioester hydrolase
MGSTAEQGWATELELRLTDIDYLGHLTAAAYPMLYEEARMLFLGKLWATEKPTYAIVKQTLGYEHEVLLRDGPVTIAIAVTRIGTSSFDLSEVLMNRAGNVCARSAATLVAWDTENRRSRALRVQEREALQKMVR